MAKNKIRHEFDPFDAVGVDVPKKLKAEALEEVEDYLHEQILSYVGEGKSPVAGESWKRTLSPGYKKYKSQFSSAGFANLELHGDMMDAVEVFGSKGKVVTEVAGSEAAKMDGHGNYSGDSKLPRRRVIPGPGQTYKKDIMLGIKDILEKYSEEE